MSPQPPVRPDDIAVVIPAYNHARFVAEAIASSVTQGDCVAEIVVVDDGSTDDTAAVVRNLATPRLRLITQTNRGPSAARNQGWRSTRSPWVFFLDADDTIAPGALPALLAAVRTDSPSEIPYGFQEVYSDGFDRPPDFTADLALRSGRLLDEISGAYLATIFVAVFPRRCLEEIGGFDESVRYGEDFDFALRLALRHRFRRLDQPVYRARMHGCNRHGSFSSEARLEYVRTIERVFRGRWHPRERWARQAGISYRWMQYACHLRDAGELVAAKNAFCDAWINYPLRLGNLRAWLLGR